MNKIICIVGPTASGKTALSVELAKMLDTEIVSADSMQIYKDLNVGTAKPSEEEMQGIKHHMFDICSIAEDFSAAEFTKQASVCVDSILAKGKIPIIVGGTGLYISALIEGNTFSGEEKDEAYRIYLNELAKEKGNEYLHNMLKDVDKESSDRIHPNNLKRVIRALEVYHQTGKTINQVNRENKKDDRYSAVVIAPCPEDRQVLYNRINKRVDIMLENGIIEEAKLLFSCENVSKTAIQAIGYKEFFPYFKGDDTLENCVETLKQASRNYAKRQLTWFRRDSRVNWIYYKNNNFFDVFEVSTKILMDNHIK